MHPELFPQNQFHYTPHATHPQTLHTLQTASQELPIHCTLHTESFTILITICTLVLFTHLSSSLATFTISVFTHALHKATPHISFSLAHSQLLALLLHITSPSFSHFQHITFSGIHNSWQYLCCSLLSLLIDIHNLCFYTKFTHTILVHLHDVTVTPPLPPTHILLPPTLSTSLPPHTLLLSHPHPSFPRPLPSFPRKNVTPYHDTGREPIPLPPLRPPRPLR